MYDVCFKFGSVVYCNFALPPYLRLTPITASRRYNVARHLLGIMIATFVFTVRLLNCGRKEISSDYVTSCLPLTVAITSNVFLRAPFS